MREYNKDDFFTDDGVMFARALTVLFADPLPLEDGAFDVLAERLGLSVVDVVGLFDRAVVATQRHDDACDEQVRAHDADPANRYGTCEHEAYLLECERTGVW